MNGEIFSTGRIGIDRFFPIRRDLKHAYAVTGGLLVCWEKSALRFGRASIGAILRHEKHLRQELREKRPEDAEQWIRLRSRTLLSRKVRALLHRKPLWIISDRLTVAGDNGEAFFTYMQQHREIDTRFAISRKSPDYERMAAIGRVVDVESEEFRRLYLVSDVMLPAYTNPAAFRPYYADDAPIRDLTAGIRTVFLQHGVIKDDMSETLDRAKKNYTGIIVTAQAEYRSVTEGDYGYPEENIWLTGLPRFDSLTDSRQKRIYIMPTWRRPLVRQSTERPGEWHIVDSFRDSAYFRFYNALLSDERLNAAALRLGYRLIYKPHPILRESARLMEYGPAAESAAEDETYRRAFEAGALQLTDDSSTMFDFAYLRKPVVYARFDEQEFFEQHIYRRGYFDPVRDGFGEVEYDLRGTVDRLIGYMENDCRMKDEYAARADRFFAFRDRDNAKRVYERVAALGRRRDR